VRYIARIAHISCRARPAVCAALALVWLGLVTLASEVRGQAAWEYSPYQVRIWVALQATPQLSPEILPPLGAALASRSEAVLGALWSVELQAAPESLRHELLQQMDSMKAEQLTAADKKSLDVDKVYLVGISLSPEGYDVAVREIDGRSRQLGPVSRRRVASQDEFATAIWDLVLGSFTPLSRIERVTDDQIVARVRAGGLIVDPASPGLIDQGMVLRPVVRRNDRSGQPAKVGGISPLPWTLLRVDQRADALLNCKLFSGYRGVLPTRGGSRLERLALVVKQRYPSTRLVLESRGDASKRLAGYSIYSMSPEAKATAPAETPQPMGEPAAEQPGDQPPTPELLGSTDSFGAIDLPRSGLTMLYVKNGRQLLARLPILPGQADELTAQMSDDEGRLQAEGFVLALQSRALDLVARREILAARIRARLKDKKFDEAQALLEDFRRLETRQDLTRALDEAQQSLPPSDRLTKSRIDKLIADARGLLANKQLSDELINQLTRELAAAKGGGAVASKN
jgi:hypothetical protein